MTEQQGRRGTVVERFTRDLSDAATPELLEPELLPTRLARAAVGCLAVDGAGLGVYSDPGLRVPIGASDIAASRAERLQFTLGVGPSAEARAAGTLLTFDKADLDRNWRMLSASLSADTPFEAVMSVPLREPLAGVVVLDLYLTSDSRLGDIDRADVDVVVGLVTGELVRAALFGSASADSGPGWMNGEDVRRRTRVWQAMGMITLVTELESADALAALRARAFTEGRLVDELAEDLVLGVVDPRAVSARVLPPDHL